MIAIYTREGSYSDRWVTYCQDKGMPYRVVDILEPGFAKTIPEYSALLWHWVFYDNIDLNLARTILNVATLHQVKTFPNTDTCWHFDDKVAQKYLLESINAPHVKTWVFFNRKDTERWLEHMEYPFVFKLRGGAGSSNVRLLANKKAAQKVVRQMYGRGVKQAYGYFDDGKRKVRSVLQRDDLWGVVKRLPRAYLSKKKQQRLLPRESNYFYAQEFLPGNNFDTRITIIGERVFGFRRFVRKNDFRASGSGDIDFDPLQIDERCIEIGLQVARKLKTQTLAIDFIKDRQGEMLITEVSYAFAGKPIHDCSGYWDAEHKWHAGHFWPEDLIIEDLLHGEQCC